MSPVSKFDMDYIETEAMLFQAGCLTIAEELRGGFHTLYRTGDPNFGVRVSLKR